MQQRRLFTQLEFSDSPFELPIEERDAIVDLLINEGWEIQHEESHKINDDDPDDEIIGITVDLIREL